MEAGSGPLCGKKFPPHQRLVLTLLQCPYSPHVQSHASTSVCRLKIPNTGSKTIVWTHKSQTLAAIPLSGLTKTLHTLIRMGSAALAATVPYPGKST